MQMQVYSLFHKDVTTSIAYRWRTLLQWGESWEVVGTVFLRHPGTTEPIDSIYDEDTKQALQFFAKEGKMSAWYHFRPCPTMRAIEQLFLERNEGKPLEGVVQVFHLTNVCGGEKKTRSYDEQYATTTKVDNTMLVPPIYLGWGSLEKEPKLRRAAQSVFLLAQTPAYAQHYLSPYFDKNYFVHPLSLMTTHRDSFESTLYRKCFLENTTKPTGINELLYRHHHDVKNASRSQEILEFLPSFSIAPFAMPKRIAPNALILTTAAGIHIEVHCEDEEFVLLFYCEEGDINAYFDFSPTAKSMSMQPEVHLERGAYAKRIPLEFVGNVYDDVQTIALFLRQEAAMK